MDVDNRIMRIKAHKGVKGLIIADSNGKVMRVQMGDEPGFYPTKIANDVTALAKKARSVVRDLNPLNDLTFFRVRSRKQEIMVAPDK